MDWPDDKNVEGGFAPDMAYPRESPEDTYNTFTNFAQAALWFAQFSLATWATKIEAEFARSVFVGDTHKLEIDLSGLTRGDFATRWSTWKIASDAGVLDASEIRAIEGFNPRKIRLKCAKN